MDSLLVSRILRQVRDVPGQEAKKWLRRAQCQLAFANGLVELLPESERAVARAAIQDAEAILAGYDPEAGVSGVEQTVRNAEASLAPLAHAAKRYAILCVGHGHIDMNWMWSWQETVSVTHDTFASVLSFMRQYPDFTYSQSQASVYALVEKYHPAMFEEIRRRVKEGRWEVTAAHWVEGDKNLASGEALAHHLLYTRRYFEDKFGLTAEDLPLDWEPDTFGHANTLPNILRQGGVKYYYCCRPGGGHGHPRIGDARPPVFWWEGPDGSRVLVNRETTWYNSYVNIGDDIAAPMLAFAKETGFHTWLNVYGVGNHGGGPTRNEVDYYLEMREWPIYPVVRFGTCKEYFEAIEAEIAGGVTVPVLDHELNYEFTGCYTAQSAIKRANRFGENYMAEAETLSALAHRVAAAPYPGVRLREGWLNVLFNQFHDILPGSGIAATREHALGLFQETAAIAGAAKREATLALARNLDTARLLPESPEGHDERALLAEGSVNTPFVAGAGMGARQTGLSNASGGGLRFLPFVVTNPCAWERSEPVSVDLYDTDFEPSRIVARDENGVEHPTLFLGKGHDWGHDKITVLFLAENVPALGYKTYLLCEGSPVAPSHPVRRPAELSVTSPNIEATFDRRTGSVTRLGLPDGPAIGDGVHFPAVSIGTLNEHPRGMTAWVLGDTDGASEELVSERFHLRAGPVNEGTGASVGAGSLAALVEASLKVPGTESTVKARYLLYGLDARLDAELEIDWREIGTESRGVPSLLLSVFAGLEWDPVEEGVFETPYGIVRRVVEDDQDYPQDVPSLRFATFRAEDGLFVTLLQDSKYGHRLDGSQLTLRLIRSSFDPDHAPEVGVSKVRFAVVLHDHEPTPADLARLGASFNHPFLVTPANLQGGTESTTRQTLSVEPLSVVVSNLKVPEEGDGLIVRLVNYAETPVTATLSFDPALIAGLATATLTDLMERPNGDWWTLEGTRVDVPIAANSFATLRLDP
ncbi:MAG: alpha-mannosidase [Fimbriimonadaceae bacterium]|nr:alpha-mannosidase [Fimbriimonadaceae bacterium]